MHFGSILKHFIRFWPILEHFWDIVLGTFLIFFKTLFSHEKPILRFFWGGQKVSNHGHPRSCTKSTGWPRWSRWPQKKREDDNSNYLFKEKNMATMATRPIPVDFVQELGWPWIETFWPPQKNRRIGFLGENKVFEKIDFPQEKWPFPVPSPRPPPPRPPPPFCKGEPRKTVDRRRLV